MGETETIKEKESRWKKIEEDIERERHGGEQPEEVDCSCSEDDEEYEGY